LHLARNENLSSVRSITQPVTGDIIVESFIMRISRVLIIATAGIAAYAMLLPAGAQQPAPGAPPPKLEKLEEGEPPAVTIRGADSERNISQKRDQGTVTSVKVKSGSSTYYLKPNTPAGSAVPGDAQSNMSRAAQWQVLEFDWNSDPEKAREAAAAQTAAVPPPPPAAPAASTKKK
jgi:hypothetical protein